MRSPHISIYMDKTMTYLKTKQYYLGFLLIVLVLTPGLFARTIIDMNEQQVTLPEKVTKLYATSPTSTYMLYTIDASLIIGLNFDHSRGHNKSSNMLDPHFTSLPVIGGLQGGGSINRETLLALHPDAVISWNTDASSRLAATLLQSSGIPTINVNLESITDIPKAYRFLGELLDKKERTEALAFYAEETIQKTQAFVKNLPSKRPLVYYAQGLDGLSTECDVSSHYQVIALAGGINPHVCKPSSGKGMEKITLEQVILYNLEVIIAQEEEFVQQVKSDSRWRFIEAVKNNRVYLVPKVPFNWIDRPPSFMRLLGVQWMTHVLYGAPNKEELKTRTYDFYRLFLNVDLSQKQIQDILE